MQQLYVKKSKIAGNGLYIKEGVKKGKLISYIHGPIRVIGRHNSHDHKIAHDWIGVGRRSWIDTKNSPYRYINHSCEPNVIVTGKRTVVALKDLSKDTEIVMDYSLTEADDNWSMQCQCKAQKCRKIIKPIGSIPQTLFTKYLPYISKNFQKIYSLERRQTTS